MTDARRHAAMTTNQLTYGGKKGGSNPILPLLASWLNWALRLGVLWRLVASLSVLFA